MNPEIISGNNADHLQQAFYRLPQGKKILNCIQCGTCSASCPLTDRMDHAPRELFALFRDGAVSEVLQSNTPWFCVSCYQCLVRCPQDIPVADLMYHFKQLALAHHCVPKSHKLPDFYKVFMQELKRRGRITGAMLMVKYGLHHPKIIMDGVSLGFKLFTRMRLDWPPQAIENPTDVADLLERKVTR